MSRLAVIAYPDQFKPAPGWKFRVAILDKDLPI